MTPCTCNHVVPTAMEHAIGCPTRIEAHGGDTKWNTRQPMLIENVCWEFDREQGTWRPHNRYYVYYQIIKKDKPTAVAHSGFIASPNKKLNVLCCTEKARELGYRVLNSATAPGLTQLRALGLDDRITHNMHCHITEDPDTGYCIPDTESHTLYLE